MNNISLIGMPGAGKSTTGIVLAKTIGYSFVDTDVLIQNQEKRLLQDIIANDGMNPFLKIESKVITSWNYEKCVIATGGSAVLSDSTMAFLSDISTVVYLKLNLDELIKRIDNIHTRGIVMSEKQTLHDVYEIREPVYEQYADLIIDCNNKDLEDVIENILKFLK